MAKKKASKASAPASKGDGGAVKPRAMAMAAMPDMPAAPVAPAGAKGVNVLTNRFGNDRIGTTMAESKLDTTSVAVPTFGRLFGRTVDGDLYAQPLVVSGVGPNGRNVVYLATSRNWVYAYDADDPNSCLPLWSRNLGQPVPRNDIFDDNYLNFAGEIGITSTPAIELDGQGGGTIYVVYKVRNIAASGDPATRTFHYYIRALDILTGADRPGAGNPTEIAGQVKTADGTEIVFDARLHLNRPGLLLSDGVIYLAFGSHGDRGDFFGWIMGYDSKTLAQVAIYNTAPDWGQGGIWQSGTGLAADSDGFIYAVVGNGRSPRTDQEMNMAITGPVFGNAIIKMKLNRGKATMDIVDWFTASDTMNLNKFDNDFIGGPVLFEAPAVPGSSGHLIIGGGKDGKIYLGDRNNLGKWSADRTNPNALQALQLCTYHIHGAPVIWKNPKGDLVAFVWSEKDFLKALSFNGKGFDVKPLSTSVYGFPEDELRMPGGILAVSADGDRDGSAIVWASHPTNDDGMNQTVRGTLRAYDARDLNNELWNSDMDAEGSDRVGSFAKFCPPVIANGKVYLATFSRELAVYGLFADVGRQARGDQCGVFRLRAIGPGVQQSGNYTCNLYDLRITGAGIGLQQDSFLFAYDNRDSEDEDEISITAQVNGINAPNYPNPYVGVMIRKFEDHFMPTMTFAAIVATKDGNVRFLHRDAVGAMALTDGPRAINFPCYLRLTASKVPGEVGMIDFSAEFMSPGTDWTTLSSVTKIPMDGRLMVGLVASAQLGNVPDTTTDQAHAKFSNVTVAPAITDVTSAPPMDMDMPDHTE